MLKKNKTFVKFCVLFNKKTNKNYKNVAPNLKIYKIKDMSSNKIYSRSQKIDFFIEGSNKFHKDCFFNIENRTNVSEITHDEKIVLDASEMNLYFTFFFFTFSAIKEYFSKNHISCIRFSIILNYFEKLSFSGINANIFFSLL